MAGKQDMTHKYNDVENLELDNPVYYPESSYPDSSYPASPYSEAPPYTYAPNSADPYTETPYTEAPFTNAPYIAPPYPGAPFSQYSSSAVCVEQPRPTTTIIVREAQSYMGLALFTCFCCFWPLACVAIYKANESQNCLARGDFVGAAARARESRNYSIGSIALGIVCLAIVVIITVITPYHR